MSAHRAPMNDANEVTRPGGITRRVLRELEDIRSDLQQLRIALWCVCALVVTTAVVIVVAQWVLRP